MRYSELGTPGNPRSEHADRKEDTGQGSGFMREEYINPAAAISIQCRREKLGMSLSSADRQLLAECEVHTFRASGPGGQHRNVTESAVRLVHRPTGITVTCSGHRSQHRNRREALEILRERIATRGRRRKRRVPTRPGRGAVEGRLQEKKRRARTKRERERIEPE